MNTEGKLWRALHYTQLYTCSNLNSNPPLIFFFFSQCVRFFSLFLRYAKCFFYWHTNLSFLFDFYCNFIGRKVPPFSFLITNNSPQLLTFQPLPDNALQTKFNNKKGKVFKNKNNCEWINKALFLNFNTITKWYS